MKQNKSKKRDIIFDEIRNKKVNKKCHKILSVSLASLHENIGNLVLQCIDFSDCFFQTLLEFATWVESLCQWWWRYNLTTSSNILPPLNLKHAFFKFIFLFLQLIYLSLQHLFIFLQLYYVLFLGNQSMLQVLDQESVLFTDTLDLSFGSLSPSQ